MIVGDLVRFRLPESQHDHELMVKWRNDPAIKPYFYNDEPVSLETHMKWWAKVSQDFSQRNYIIDACIYDKDEVVKVGQIGEVRPVKGYLPIGMTSLMSLDFLHRTGEYARFKIDPAYQGKGYAYDAEMTLLKHAFDRLNLNRVWLHAFDDNEAVINLHYKTGFKLEGTMRQHIYKDGRYRDIAVMAILADEWRAKHKKQEPQEGMVQTRQRIEWEAYMNIGP